MSPQPRETVKERKVEISAFSIQLFKFKTKCCTYIRRGFEAVTVLTSKIIIISDLIRALICIETLTLAAGSESRGARSRADTSPALALSGGVADAGVAAGRVASVVGEADHLEDVEHCKRKCIRLSIHCQTLLIQP